VEPVKWKHSPYIPTKPTLHWKCIIYIFNAPSGKKVHMNHFSILPSLLLGLSSF
jgi:hypothetical protein